MTAGGGKRNGRNERTARQSVVAPVLLVFLAADVAVVAFPSPASAQDSGGLFGRIFGRSQPQRRYIDPPGNYAPPPRYYIDPPVPARPRKNVNRPRPQDGARNAAPDAGGRAAGTAATAAVPAPIAKAADARVVLVVGDFMALSLAKGLEGAVADDPNVRIVDRTDGSSGLVRDDHFDWPARIGAIIDEEKPAAVAVMLGSNDRQEIRRDGRADDVRSQEWTAEYTRRMDALAKTVAERKLPLVWVGLPAFKSARMNDDVAYFNELYRQAATSAGGEFVDVWDGFVDANGAFVSTGPDVAGQPARLRNSDGITMTPQGGAKLAFFAEKSLEKIIGTGPGAATLAAATPDAGKAVPQNPANATAVPPIALASPVLDGGETLLGGMKPQADSSQPSPRERLVAVGAPLPVATGRADDFAWNVKTGPVGPTLPQAPIVSRGSVDLGAMRSGANRPGPMQPMPSLQDAIIEDWKAEAQAQAAANAAAGEKSKPQAPSPATP